MMTYLKKFLKEPAHTFHNEYDDEYYINEIIGIEEITYEDWIRDREETKT